MVARDGIEPPPPAFADPQQQALSTTYKSRETAEVLGNTRKLRQLLTRTADRSQAAFPAEAVIFPTARDQFSGITRIAKN